MDYSLIRDIAPAVTQEMSDIEYRLGCSNFQHITITDMNAWSPSKTLRSPVKLGDRLYNIWGLQPDKRFYSEKTGKPSTDKAALTYLADKDDKVVEILRWRQLNTQLSKYLQSPLKARTYLGNDVVHPDPSIFSTYTGRMTYKSKTKQRFHTGVALHQWPRLKEFRKLIRPRKGYKHVEFDAASQESRLMAEMSGDQQMTSVFVEKKDFHSMTGAEVSGMSYADFMKAKSAGNTAVTGPHGYRYQGKFCIAKGQLVDTDRGPVPIEDVTILDKVWDGVQYVSHKGVVHMGRKEVITRDGVTGTPDHKVLTASGWKQLKEVSQNEIRRSNPYYEGQAIWDVDCEFGQVDPEVVELVHGLYMSMREVVSNLMEQPETWKIKWVPELQVSGRSALQTDYVTIPRRKKTVREYIRSSVSKLWCTRDQDEVRDGISMVCISPRYIPGSGLVEDGSRSDRQRWTLRAWKSTCSKLFKELKQSAKQSVRGLLGGSGLPQSPLALIEVRRAGILVCPRSGDATTQGGVHTGAYRGDACASKTTKGKVDVYDIVDAGPRHRFTVQGRIVSNCNLSNNYRIGVRKLQIQARVQYGMKVDFNKAKTWQDAFHRLYPNVKAYWKDAIAKAKQQKYAVTLAGRRFYLMFWGEKDQWATESSAINHPIQGSGADMKDLAIQEIHKHFPEFEFWFDLHDGLHYEVPVDVPDARLIECRSMLDNLDYKAWWGVDLKVPLTWDASVGARWSELEEL